MKILVINWQDITNPFGGGAEIHLHHIFKRIAALGNEVTLFCSSYPDAKSDDIIDGIKIIRRGKRNTFNYIVPSFYKRYFKNQGYDIVIDDINKIPFYTPLYVKEKILAISHHFFGKSIFREVNFISGLYVVAAEKLVDYVYKKTPFAVVSQSTLDEFLHRGFNPMLFEIIPNAIEHEYFPMKVCEKNPFPTITYFGRLKKYKSIDHLLKAFKIVSTEFPQAQLYIIGAGDFRENLEKLAAELGISNQTRFFGYVSDKDKVELMSKSHLVVNTSMKEGWGITNIEANACGTPVLSANVPGLKDSVKVGFSGDLYEYGNINQLAQKIAFFLKDSEYLNRLSKSSVDWARSFSWDSSATKMLNLCERVLQGEFDSQKNKRV